MHTFNARSFGTAGNAVIYACGKANETGETHSFEWGNDQVFTIPPGSDPIVVYRDFFRTSESGKTKRGRIVYPPVGPEFSAGFTSEEQAEYDAYWQRRFKVDERYYGKGKGGITLRLMWQFTSKGRGGEACPCEGPMPTSLADLPDAMTSQAILAVAVCR